MLNYILITFFIIPFFIFFTKKKWSLLKKTLVFLGCQIISFCILCGLFFYLWNSSDSPREEGIRAKEYFETTLKKIILINEKNEKIFGEIYFEYSQDEIDLNQYNIVNYYNKKTSFILNSKSRNFIILPIRVNDSIQFPNKFTLTIRDSLQNIIATYKRNDFFKSISKTSEQIEIVNNEWELIIK